ncbi:hypothetical protein NBRC116583_12110 [Arenicella sp. 4NH20-0111]|uniref:hypothetical protein n=1 Tax=Arenicella sp. 4NH20-0111 TaxID=3127648 RepID=UPI00310B262E
MFEAPAGLTLKQYVDILKQSKALDGLSCDAATSALGNAHSDGLSRIAFDINDCMSGHTLLLDKSEECLDL